MYKAKYDTQIDGNFYKKDAEISFKNGTDSGYIARLVREGVIIKVGTDSNKKAESSVESSVDSNTEPAKTHAPKHKKGK